MKNKFSKTLGTLILSSGLTLNSFAQTKEAPCISKEEVMKIRSEIQRYFKKTEIHDYLIEFVPEAKKGYDFGGELSVYIPASVDSAISIFDRTSLNQSEWYNVTNWSSKNKGCADWGIYLNIKPAKELSKIKRQKKFNESIYKIRKIINEKKNGK